jgi:hypothetical protein
MVSATANDIEQTQNDIDKARAPRWIQANAWRGDATASRRTFACSRSWECSRSTHRPTEKARVDAPFPDNLVDFTQGDVSITVHSNLQALR